MDVFSFFTHNKNKRSKALQRTTTTATTKPRKSRKQEICVLIPVKVTLVVARQHERRHWREGICARVRVGLCAPYFGAWRAQRAVRSAHCTRVELVPPVRAQQLRIKCQRFSPQHARACTPTPRAVPPDPPTAPTTADPRAPVQRRQGQQLQHVQAPDLHTGWAKATR